MRRDGFFDGLLVGLRALTSDNRSWRVAHMNGCRKTFDIKVAACALLSALLTVFKEAKMFIIN